MNMLQGKTALITGASRGIGYAIAEAMYNEGAKVYIVARNAEELKKSAAQIDVKNENRVIPIAFDVANLNAIKDAVKQIEANGDSINVLVNNAGVNLRGTIEEISEETFDTVLNVNLKSIFFLTQAVYPMLKKEGGKIVNIASLMSEIARPNISPYCASKGGVRQLTKAMAIEGAEFNIQANGITPGYIATEMNKPLIENKDFNEFIINRTPAKRWGDPKDIASTAVFLASSGSDYITGQIIAVDGGILAAL